MSTTLSITSSDIDAEDLNELTLDLCRTINSETEITAEPAQSPQERRGVKGDMLAIGTIVLGGLLGSGGVVVTLINVLKSHLERGRPMEIELERPDGAKLKIKGDDVKEDQLDRTMKLAQDFFKVPAKSKQH
jgi:hypothetical protein